ncbi:MAG: glycosyltransferase family 2 protein [Gammaproteobacteria bacterium]
MISVIIITLNEEENIRACLESVVWADEIVVVDSGSSDATREICREFTDKILLNENWQGYGYQKNLALQQATGDWVLSLDADERVSQELRRALQAVIASPQADAYALPRQAYFLGKAMRHGGWWPDYVVRLFRRGKGRFSDVIVHETVQVQGSVKKLKEPIIHYSYVSLEQLLAKINKYSSAGALQAQAKNKRGSMMKALGKGCWTFFRAYCLRAGFLDGAAGLIAALAKAEETYYRYLKLAYLQR